MIELAQETNFANDVTGHAALGRRVGKGNPFNGDNFVRIFLASLVDNSVSTLSHYARAVDTVALCAMMIVDGLSTDGFVGIVV
jgi:hypothetical protein